MGLCFMVHLRVVAGADEAALPDGEGQAVVVLVVPDGGQQGMLQSVQPAQAPDHGSERLARHALGLLGQLGQDGQPSPQQ